MSVPLPQQVVRSNIRGRQRQKGTCLVPDQPQLTPRREWPTHLRCPAKPMACTWATQLSLSDCAYGLMHATCRSCSACAQGC